MGNQKQQHTPEPWANTATQGITVTDAQGDFVCRTATVDDGARIVACVNAFAGIEHPQLFVDNALQNASRLLEISQQRDELLDLLKKMTAFAQEDFRPGFAKRSDAYIEAYNASHKLIYSLTRSEE